MNEDNDAALLAQFAHDGCEDAFRGLVARHIHLVHSVALRHTDNPHKAEEITQAVFILLAQKARSLKAGTVLAGWLYHTARLTACNSQRAELRRVRREHQASMDLSMTEPCNETEWRALAPFLDEAMAALGRRDRDAIVMRFFQNKSLEELAGALGLKERAAQKRVSRALEKLRGIFTRRGLNWTAAMIAGALSVHSVHAAPTTMVATVSAAALQGSAVAGSTMTLVNGTIHIMNWMKLKVAAVVAASSLVVAGAGVAVTHHNRIRAEEGRARALEEKHQAEREAAGAGNLAADPGAQKLEDERRALNKR